MTIDELKQDSLFITLPENYKKFVVLYLESNGAKTDSALKTWNCKNSASADSMARRALNRPDVRMLVAKFFGENPAEVPFTQDELLGFISKKVRTLPDEEEALRFNYVKILLDMNGWKQKPAEPNKENAEPSVWDEVRQLEAKQ
jgi:hypothetical protein